MTEHVYIVDLLRSVYSWMYDRTPELIGNTVVLITLTVDAPFLYYNFCAEQSAMKFTCESVIPASSTTFTTPARKDTCSAPRFGATVEQEEFFYGYKSLAEAQLHNALPIYDEKDESEAIWDCEGLDVKKPSKRAEAQKGWMGSQQEMPALQTRLQTYPCCTTLQSLAAHKLDIQSDSHRSDDFILSMDSFTDSDCAVESDPVIPRSEPKSSPACSSTSTHDEVIFPPLRAGLFDEFKRTFHHVARGADGDKRYCAHKAIMKPAEEFTPWSFYGMSLEETNATSEDDHQQSSDALGLASMFEEQ
jgi:hypothetical protein